VFASLKLAWVPGIVVSWFVLSDDPIIAGIIAVVSLLFGAMLLKPVRLRTTESGTSLGVLRRFRWEWWSSEEIAVIQHAHWPGMPRATASLRFQTVDGTKVYLPGTMGRMLLRSPDLEVDPRPSSSRLRVVLTTGFLRLVRNSFDQPIETEGAEWFSPAQPK